MKTNHHQLCMALLAVTVLASTAPATIMVYDNLVDYLATGGLVGASNFSFDGWSDGSPLNGQMDWELDTGFGYGLHAHAELGLWSNPGALSTVNAYDPLVFTFENSPLGVVSFGGYFASGDDPGNIINQDLVFTATDGGLDVVQVTIPGSQFAGGSQFVGFVSYDLLTQVTLDGVDDPNPNWPQVDKVWVNSPEPTTLVLLALGGCILMRKRRV